MNSFARSHISILRGSRAFKTVHMSHMCTESDQHTLSHILHIFKHLHKLYFLLISIFPRSLSSMVHCMQYSRFLLLETRPFFYLRTMIKLRNTTFLQTYSFSVVLFCMFILLRSKSLVQSMKYEDRYRIVYCSFLHVYTFTIYCPQ